MGKRSSGAKPFEKCYRQIRTILKDARSRVYHHVNDSMVRAYWEIGRRIVEEEQKGRKRAEYGTTLLRGLSERLGKEFGRGFDDSNLRYMRLFYTQFQNRDALRHKLGWTHYRLLLGLGNRRIREFYLREASSNRWSTRELERQVNAHLFERRSTGKKELKKGLERGFERQ